MSATPSATPNLTSLLKLRSTGGRIGGQYWNVHRKLPPSLYRTITSSSQRSGSPLFSSPHARIPLAAETPHKVERLPALNGRRTFFSGAGSKRLEGLERQVESGRASGTIWASYFRELNKMDSPKEVIRQFERLEESAKTQEVVKEYLKALVLTGRLEGANLGHLLSRGASGGAGGNAGRLTLVADSPIPITVVGGSLTGSAGGSTFSKIANVTGFMVSLAILYYLFTAMFKGGDSIMGVNTKVKFAQKSNITFEDVLGVDEAKSELQEVVQYLKDPQKYTKLGAKLPKGILLVGPPGTGKTLLAKAIAGEAGVPFLYCSGSEFDEVFVGVGPRRVRKLFEEAKKNAPAIIFIDELDSVGGSRNRDHHQVYTHTINQLLTEMDGFQENQGVIVLAATNFPDVLDPALTRPGRFDKQVEVPRPDVRGRKMILEHYLKKIVVAPDVNVDMIARGTPGFTGAELANLVNIAATKAATKGMEAVTTACMDEARDDVMMGVQRKSMIMSDDEKKLTAYHEGGHALVAIYTEGAKPLHKATILPRGRALGVTHFLPESDQLSLSRMQIMADVAVAMGGRAAEEVIFGPKMITTGASSDFKHATRLANAMVAQMGMSDKVGPIYRDERDLERASSETRQKIESEVEALLQGQYAVAKRILTDHQDELHRLAQALLEHETLNKEEIMAVIKGKKLTNLFYQ